MDVAQSEFLALLLEESLSHRPTTGNASRPGPGVVTWQSRDPVAEQQQPVSVEGGGMVGCQRERVEPTKELTFDQLNPFSFLNTDMTNATNVVNANTTDTDTNTNAVELGGGSLFDCMLDTILGSSAKEAVGISTPETPSNSPSPSPSLVTSCEVATVDGSAVVDDLFEADLDKLLHPFAESILNPAGGDVDAWDIESMLTAVY